jgi:tetratricopeptide (TPR) repeat protein
MKVFFTFFSFAAVIAAGSANAQRQELPTSGGGRTNLPSGGHFPTVFIPTQATEATAPDYQQLVATGDYYFNQKRYGDAIDQYNKALAQRQEQYPKDQILRAKAQQAREEKATAMRTEAERKAGLERIPQSEFVSKTLTNHDWKNAALVCDVTGSMGTYNDQVLTWLRDRIVAGDSSVRRVVLFNDGDGRKDETKELGAAGGLYSFVPTTYAAAAEQVRIASRAGSGGDFPENNIEALLKAQADCPSCENLVMIADNSAPRDIELASQVTKPVQILVCGAPAALQTAYLDLARMTKGSVHFNGKSYTGLDTYAEGATLQIDNTTYTVQDDRFVRTN